MNINEMISVLNSAANKMLHDNGGQTDERDDLIRVIGNLEILKSQFDNGNFTGAFHALARLSDVK